MAGDRRENDPVRGIESWAMHQVADAWAKNYGPDDSDVAVNARLGAYTEILAQAYGMHGEPGLGEIESWAARRFTDAWLALQEAQGTGRDAAQARMDAYGGLAAQALKARRVMAKQEQDKGK